MAELSLNRSNRCSLHQWTALQSRVLFAFERVIPLGDADGSYVRRAQYGAVLVRRGWYEMESEGQRIVARPGQWAFSFTDRHRQRFPDQAMVLALRLSNTWPDDVPMFEASRKLFTVDAAAHPEIERLAMRFVESAGAIQIRAENPIYTYTQRSRVGLSAFIEHQQAVLHWLALMADILPRYGVTARYPHGVDARLSMALDIIDGLPLSNPLPVRKMETVSGLTLQQLDRLCRRSFGMTTRQYWDRRRVEQVMFRLKHPAAGVKEVAMAAGFTQLSHFSAWFKRHAEMSPRAYREIQLGELPSD